MHISFRTRRTAALMAASALGVSGLVLGVTGVASADTSDPEIHFSTNSADAANDPGLVLVAPGGNLDVPAGFCTVEWDVLGGNGGDGEDDTANSLYGEAGTEGVEIGGTSALDRTVSTTFTLFPGAAAKNGSDGGDGGTSLRGADAGGNGVDNSSDGFFGGGGGAASTVVKGGTVYLSAPGGAGGAGGSGGAGGAGGGPQQLQTGVTATGTNYGDGSISGTAYSCATAPKVNWVSGSGEHSLDFQIWDQSYLPGNDTITGLQYTVDNGSTWTTLADADLQITPDRFQWQGSITGLASGSYSVKFRWATTGGPGNASDAEPAATLLPAPTSVSAVVGTSSIKVTWQAPADTSSITGYTAWASSVADAGQQSGNEPPHCAAVGAGTLICTVFVPAGTAYDVIVGSAGTDRGGMTSDPVRTGVVPAATAPTSVPTGADALNTPTGAPSGLAQGSSVTLTGSGYAPNSTVSVYIYSTPTLLGTVVTNGAGSFSQAFTIPTTLAPGSHNLVAAGVDVNGNPRYQASAVTVAQAKGSLAWTGFETLPVLGAGLLTVVLGLGLMVVARRRRTA